MQRTHGGPLQERGLDEKWEVSSLYASLEKLGSRFGTMPKHPSNITGFESEEARIRGHGYPVTWGFRRQSLPRVRGEGKGLIPLDGRQGQSPKRGKKGRNRGVWHVSGDTVGIVKTNSPTAYGQQDIQTPISLALTAPAVTADAGPLGSGGSRVGGVLRQGLDDKGGKRTWALVGADEQSPAGGGVRHSPGLAGFQQVHDGEPSAEALAEHRVGVNDAADVIGSGRVRVLVARRHEDLEAQPKHVLVGGSVGIRDQDSLASLYDSSGQRGGRLLDTPRAGEGLSQEVLGALCVIIRVAPVGHLPRELWGWGLSGSGLPEKLKAGGRRGWSCAG